MNLLLYYRARGLPLASQPATAIELPTRDLTLLRLGASVQSKTQKPSFDSAEPWDTGCEGYCGV